MIGFLLCPLWYWQPFHISKCRGAEGTCKALPNEALCKHPRKHGLITRAYLRQTSLNCWFLFLRTAAQRFHSHSFEFCWCGTFATSTRTSKSTHFGTSFKSQNQSSVCCFISFGFWSRMFAAKLPGQSTNSRRYGTITETTGICINCTLQLHGPMLFPILFGKVCDCILGWSSYTKTPWQNQKLNHVFSWDHAACRLRPGRAQQWVQVFKPLKSSIDVQWLRMQGTWQVVYMLPEGGIQRQVKNQTVLAGGLSCATRNSVYCICVHTYIYTYTSMCIYIYIAAVLMERQTTHRLHAQDQFICLVLIRESFPTAHVPQYCASDSMATCFLGTKPNRLSGT